MVENFNPGIEPGSTGNNTDINAEAVILEWNKNSVALLKLTNTLMTYSCNYLISSPLLFQVLVQCGNLPESPSPVTL